MRCVWAPPLPVSVVPVSVSVTMIRGVVWELRARGVDPTQPLDACGLDEGALHGTRATVSTKAYHRFVHRALAATEDPALGLAMGMRAPESMLHVVGHLMLASGTLREALTWFQRYSPWLATGGVWSFTEEGESATFGYAPALQLGDSTRFTNELVMAMAWRNGLHADDALCTTLSQTASRLLRERCKVTIAARVRSVLRSRVDLSDLSIATLAYRAFKRWTGRTPSADAQALATSRSLSASGET